MMRKTVWMGLILIAAGIVGMVWTFKGTDFLTFTGDSYYEQKTISAAGIAELLVKASSADVEVIRGAGSDIVVTLSGKINARARDKMELKLEQQGERLEVILDQSKGFTIGIQIMTLKLEVALPPEQWAQLQLEAGSGNLKLSGLEAELIKAKAASGNLTMENYAAGTLEYKLGSGNVKLSNGRAGRMLGDSSSGNFRWEGDVLEETNIKIGSGNIRIEADRIEANTALRSSSGNIHVMLAEQPQSMAVDYDGGSGRAKIDWSGFNYSVQKEDRITGSFGAGEIQLNARTGSGNFTLGKR